MRLIDADALLKYILSGRWKLEAQTSEILRIQNAPTIEARPVVYARWEICSDGYYPYCSACKSEPPSGKMTKFCPECGADMRGGRKT